MNMKMLAVLISAMAAGGLGATPVAEPSSVAVEAELIEDRVIAVYVQDSESQGPGISQVHVIVNGRKYGIEELPTVPELSQIASAESKEHPVPCVCVYAAAGARWSSVAMVVESLSDMGIRMIQMKLLPPAQAESAEK